MLTNHSNNMKTIRDQCFSLFDSISWEINPKFHHFHVMSQYCYANRSTIIHFFSVYIIHCIVIHLYQKVFKNLQTHKICFLLKIDNIYEYMYMYLKWRKNQFKNIPFLNTVDIRKSSGYIQVKWCPTKIRLTWRRVRRGRCGS